MSERKKSVESFDEFFGSSKTDNDDEKKQEENDLTKSSAVAALIRAQPIVHHRQTPSEIKQNINSKKPPLTTTVKNTPTKSNRVDSEQSKVYESDFDDDKGYEGDETSNDGKKNHSPLPPPKHRLVENPRRGSDSKLKASYTITNGRGGGGIRQKEKFLPYIRAPKRRKSIKTRRPKQAKSEFEQRILSAQHDEANKLQSRLADLRRQLEEQRIENKTLRLIQKREEKVLKKYQDQEYDIHKVAQDFTNEIEQVTEIISDEREMTMKLEEQINKRDETLRDQTKRVRYYKKLVDEKNLDDPDELREKLKNTDKELKQLEDKIANKEKYIENLEKTYHQEINQELLKQRDLKHEIEEKSKDYIHLLHKFEKKTRQIDTMHIYIQRGGQRPSHTSLNLSKSRSLQSLQDTSPRFREKIVEYDKKRREQEKLKPKPPPTLIPIKQPPPPPPKPERKKYVPKRPMQTIKSPAVTSHVIKDEQPSTIQNGHLPSKEKTLIHHLPPSKKIEEESSDIDDDTLLESSHHKSPSPPTTPIQRREQYVPHALIYKRSLTPVSRPPQSKINSTETSGNTTTSNLFKYTQPSPPLTKPINDEWPDMFDTDKKDDRFPKLISPEQEETTDTPPSPPASQRPSMIMIEPSSSITTTTNQNKLPARMTTTNNYDFDQSIINLHEGKPVTTQSTVTKTSVDPFESLFGGNNSIKPITPTNNRDDTLTITETKTEPFESLFGETSSTRNISRQFPTQTDKLRRPKIVTNATRTIPNRTVVEEIEELVL